MWLNMGDHDFFMWYYLGWFETVLNIDMRKNNTFLLYKHLLKMLYELSVCLNFLTGVQSFDCLFTSYNSFLIHLFLF